MIHTRKQSLYCTHTQQYNHLSLLMWCTALPTVSGIQTVITQYHIVVLHNTTLLDTGYEITWTNYIHIVRQEYSLKNIHITNKCQFYSYGLMVSHNCCVVAIFWSALHFGSTTYFDGITKWWQTNAQPPHSTKNS